MYYFFPGTHIEELEAEKLMGGSLGVEHTHDMLVLFVNLIVGLENHPPVQRDSSLPVLYLGPDKMGIEVGVYLVPEIQNTMYPTEPLLMSLT